MSKFKILVIGGYGSFGRWISSALAQDPLISVVIAGRKLDQSRLFAAAMRRELKTQNIEGISLDASDPLLSNYFKEKSIKAVIHTSGPFQGQSYHVAKACIDAGCHYIDLADGREFVVGITQLDTLAKEKSIAVISGASSVPGLSSAVIKHFLPEFERLQTIEYSIVPGYKAPKGQATIQAILSYTGKPFKRWENSKWTTVHGWQDLQQHNYGSTLGKKWVAACNVPDLEIFPNIYKNLKSVKFYAGLEVKLLHFSMWGMSWATRINLVKNWAMYAKPITYMSGWFDNFGSDTGGMMIKLTGIDINGDKKTIHWRLIAKNGHGPRVPTIASIILAKKLARQELSFQGATPCIEMISLDDFTKEVEDLNITCEVY